MATDGPYVELRVPLGGLVEVGLRDLRGEAARGSAEDGLASQSPARSHSSNGRHVCSKLCVELQFAETKTGMVGENHEHRMMLPSHVNASQSPVADSSYPPFQALCGCVTEEPSFPGLSFLVR